MKSDASAPGGEPDAAPSEDAADNLAEDAASSSACAEPKDRYVGPQSCTLFVP